MRLALVMVEAMVELLTDNLPYTSGMRFISQANLPLSITSQ